MKGYTISEETYTPVGHRSISCTLRLENGYEITEAYCIDMDEMYETGKKKAFKRAYAEYKRLRNAVDRQSLFQLLPDRRVRIGQESV